MEDLVDALTSGRTAEVKVVLATVVLALGCYQLTMAAVGYGRLRPRFLAARPAFAAHRAVGDAVALVMICVGAACVAVYGFADDDDYTAHAIAGAALLAVLVLKVAVVRRGLGLGSRLPWFGVTVFVLLVVTWATSAGNVLA